MDCASGRPQESVRFAVRLVSFPCDQAWRRYLLNAHRQASTANSSAHTRAANSLDPCERLSTSNFRLKPAEPVILDETALANPDEFYARINRATDTMHAALEEGSWIYIYSDAEDLACDPWPLACVAAHLIRYRDQRPSLVVERVFDLAATEASDAGECERILSCQLL